MIVKHRRGTTQEWQEVNLTLVPEEGEIIIEECDDGTRKCKIGTGYSRFSELPYMDDKTRTDLLSEIANAKECLKNRIDNRIDNLNENFLEELNTLESDLKAIETKCSELTYDYITRDANVKASLTKSLTDAVELLKGEIASVTDYSKEAQTNLQIEISDIEAQINGIEKTFTAALTDQDKSFTNKIDELTNDYIIRDANLKAILDKDLTDTAEFLKDEIASVAEHSKEVQSSLQTEVTRIDAQIESTEKAFVADLADNIESFEIKCSELTNDYITRDANLRAILDRNLDDTTELLNNKIASVAEHSSEVQANLHTETARIDAEIAAAKEKFETDLIDYSEHFDKKLFEEAADFTEKLSKVNDRITSETAQLQEQIGDLANTVNIKIADQISELDNKVNNTIISEISRIEGELSSTTSAFDTKLINHVTEFNEKISEVVEQTDTKLTQLNNNLTSEINSLDDRVSALEETVPSVVESIADLESTTNLKFIEVQTETNTIASDVRELDSKTSSKFTEIEETIRVNREATDASLDEVTEQLTGINDRITATNVEVAEQTKRINSIIALPDGSTTADAELVDIRIGYNGVDHASAGDAVRAIGHDLDTLKASLPDYIPSNAVDGLLYENNQLWLTSKDELVGDPVTITGGSGGGGSISTVKVINNLPSASFTISKGNDAWIDFTYTSFENDVATGDGAYKVTINDRVIDELAGNVQHGIAKRLNIADYLRNGSNSVKVTCSDQYGSSRSLVYTISVIELRIESSFNSTQIFSDTITFRYKVFGQTEKTANILVDGVEVSNKTLGASVSGNEITLLIPKQTHGCHKITAFVSATIGEQTVESNTLEYEIICIEADNNAAILTSIYKTAEVTQGDLVSIPFMLYDPVQVNTNVELIISSQVAGELTEIDRSTITVNREQQFWNTRKYPVGITVFTISYTYNLYGVQTTITKSHTVKITALAVDVAPEEDSLQLYLSAQGRSNNEQNPATWTFTQAPNGDKTYDTITTSFEGFNWKSNGWITDEAGDTCLRLNGDARAVVNFKPFNEDFKANGKTIEFEFVVRDVNDRDAVVIDCFDGTRGFRATPDTAFLKSSGTEVSCRYKDEERIRVAIAVEHADTTSRFVSIYLDGILSGVQRYATTDIFRQDNPLVITFGSSLCGLDIYNVRVYDKALSTPAVLTNYIADQTVPTTRLQLMTDNDVLDENGEISYDRVKALGQIPIITFTGPMPTYKGDKKKKTTRMKFEDPAHPEMNFDVLLDQIDVQGTSSQFYFRKNWKVKLPEARAHMPGAIPANVFCIKVDYAEATGTHNTGTANYVETLYDREEVTLPPQKDDTRVRTTIQGFPCILFEKATEDSEPIFSSKGNFNYDKDSENAFGFTEEYKDFGVECWEFCNNTSDPVNFAGEILDEWLEDFEPRYVPKSANFERIEELQEIADLAASGKGIMTEAQRSELAILMRNCIANFKEMHDWVLSTATYSLVDGKKVAITPVPLESPVTYGETTYTEDNEEYRLAKFKYEFRNYFNMHYSSMYYVFTFFALMTDQRAKNLFLTRWKEDDGVYRWYPYFYDSDTIFGINNEGALVFDYFHEDTDQLGSSNVYNGQNSVLWHNFRLCFPKEIEDTYAELRNSGKLTYNKIIDQYVTQGSDKWSEAIYNADAEYKYVSMAREAIEHTDEDGNVVSGLDASNLYQVRGPGEHHLRYFIANRINYCDSKWYAGSYPSDDIFLRIYTPKPGDNATQEEIDRINASLAVVPANPAITITPFSDMYAGVRYKSGTLQQQRVKAGESFTFRPINANETFGDTETAIYGASEISSLGDLSGLYCGVISLGKASKLTELIIGNADSAYYNDNFREISVGSNRLLRYIDLRNCSGLGIAGENPQKTLELSGCPNIEHIYTEGTNLSSVDLPESGYIKTLHLPKSINTLVIRNQKNITDFEIENSDYSNIRILCVENSNLNTNELIEACRGVDGKYTVERIRLTGIEWGTDEEPLENANFVKSLFPVYDEAGNIISGVRGIDEKNNPLEDAYLVGTCYITKLTGDEYAEIKSHYPYLDIKYGEMTSNVIFMSTDGETELYRETITARNSETIDCLDPVLANKIAKPTKASTIEFDYEWTGWTRKLDGDVHADALLAITGDRVLYPAFKAIRRSYDVTFVNPTAPENGRILGVVSTLYGDPADYSKLGKPLPTKLDGASPDLYEHVGWFSSEGTTERITGDITFEAQFAVKDQDRLPGGEDDNDTLPGYTIGWLDITNCVDSAGNVFDGYTLNADNNTMSIVECNNNFNSAVRIPETLTLSETAYTITSLKGFADHTKLELIKLPDTLKELLREAFLRCANLIELELPQSLHTIQSFALQNCTKLKELIIPAQVTTIADGAFSGCINLNKLTVADGNTNFTVKQDCLIDTVNKKLIQGLAAGVIPQDGSVTALGQYCFASMPIRSVRVPEGIDTIADNAFSRCGQLEEVILPGTLKILGATCFTWCHNLSKINLPANLTTISTYAFHQCTLKNVVIPASVNTILNMSFSEIPTLETVTFKAARDDQGNIKVPYIHSGAFASTGKEDAPVVFNCPWSEEQHNKNFTGLDGEGKEKDPAFGASYYTFNFDYEEAI